MTPIYFALTTARSLPDFLQMPLIVGGSVLILSIAVGYPIYIFFIADKLD